MDFPRDHLSHDLNVEWWWMWGKFEDDTFFHAVMFLGRGQGQVIGSLHYSIHANGESAYYEVPAYKFMTAIGPFFKVSANNGDMAIEVKTKELHIVAKQASGAIVHDLKGREFYSVPSLIVSGTVNGKALKGFAGLDHEWGDLPYPFNLGDDPKDMHMHDWDCAAIKLDNDMYIGVMERKGERRCGLYMNGSVMESKEFELTSSQLRLKDMSMTLELEPLMEERQFRPWFGMRYSEQPLAIKSDKARIGWGIRERTYGGMKYGDYGL